MNEYGFDEATAGYNSAVQSAPDNADEYCGRGDACYDRGEYDQAASYYTGAIQLEPDNYIAYYNRSKAYYLKENYRRSRADIDKALRINPCCQKAHDLSDILKQRGY